MFKKEILQNQKKILDLKLVKRKIDLGEIEQVFKLNKIFAFIWARRAWKTFFTFQIVKEFIKKDLLTIENVCYIDFSEIIDKEINLEDIKNDYKIIFPDKKPVFIFDEIQELANFPEKLIKLLNQGYKIIITWSNAHLLSKELATILRGKVYSKEIFPLDFWEYLYFRNIEFDENKLILNKQKYIYEFIQFLKWWGFPEIVLTKDEFVKENILKSYFDIMIYKDLQDRYNIKNDFALKFFIKRVLVTFSKELNINKIYNELKGQNIKISKNSLYNFYEYLDNIYFISQLTNYWSQIKGTKKSYLIDVAFANLVWYEDLGKRFENFVYLELLKKYKEVYFLNKNYEIDFFVPSENLYIQVVYELNFDNLEREVKYLVKQNWKRILIYFQKEKNLVLPSEIEYCDLWGFIKER